MSVITRTSATQSTNGSRTVGVCTLMLVQDWLAIISYSSRRVSEALSQKHFKRGPAITHEDRPPLMMVQIWLPAPSDPTTTHDISIIVYCIRIHIQYRAIDNVNAYEQDFSCRYVGFPPPLAVQPDGRSRPERVREFTADTLRATQSTLSRGLLSLHQN